MQMVVDGILTNYEVLGKENKDSLVILHGWGRGYRDWVFVAEALSQRYEIILLDLPGFGGSMLPEKVVFGTWEYANFFEHFLEKLEVKQPILLGHSFGGRIGIVLGTRPALLKKLILIDSAGIEEKSLLTSARIEFFKAAKFVLPQAVAQALSGKIGSKDYRSAGALRNVLKKIVSENLRPYLRKIIVPALIIWGENDEVQEIRQAKIMKREVQNSRLRIVWSAGHNPHLEKPEDLISILREELLTNNLTI